MFFFSFALCLHHMINFKFTPIERAFKCDDHYQILVAPIIIFFFSGVKKINTQSFSVSPIPLLGKGKGNFVLEKHSKQSCN